MGFKWIKMCLCFLFLCSFLHSIEDNGDEILILAADKVWEGDLRLVGKTVEISGVVDGDLYVLASQVYVDGEVKGDIICSSGLLDISGHVERDVRAACGQAVITGQIGRSVSLACASLEVGQGARIGGNLFVFTGSCDILGHIGRNVSVFASFLRFSGEIQGKLSAHVGSLRITSKGRITKGIEYYSNEIARIDAGAQIGGDLIHKPSFVYTMASNGWIKKWRIGSKIAGSLMNFVFTLLLGLILIHYFKKKLTTCSEVIHRRFGHCVVTGIVVIIILPLISLIFLISIIGAPFALGLIALNVIGFYSAKIVTLYYVGHRLLKKWHFEERPRRFFFSLLIVYFLLTFLPYIGWILSTLFMLLGVGSVISRNLIVQKR